MLRNLDFEFGAPFLDNFFSEMSQKIIEKMLSSAWTSIAHFLGRDRFLLCTGQEKGRKSPGDHQIQGNNPNTLVY